MASKADNTPREGEILCENCGYGLDGIVPTGDALAALIAAERMSPAEWPRCPECGVSIADSVLASARVATRWETPGAKLPAFFSTTAAIIRSPRQFFRKHRAKMDLRCSRGFAVAHYWLAGYLFSVAATLHYLTLLRPLPRIAGQVIDGSTEVLATLLIAGIACPIVFAAMTAVRLLTGRLSTFESRYHGLRLPLAVVTRALHYHAACLLPTALGTLSIVLGYRGILAGELIPRTQTEMAYVYVLGAWVILASCYLFITYWSAMKSVMYASR